MANPISIQGTPDQNINGILSGVGWNATNLTYSFPRYASFYGDGYALGEPQSNYSALTMTQSAVARRVLDMIASVTNLSFTEIQETPADHATLHLAGSGASVPAWTYFPDWRRGRGFLVQGIRGPVR